jgi:LacI family transcriptional regulator
VPQDIAVVGFDDVTTARYLNPALTTVNVDAYALGQQAVEMMLDAQDSSVPKPETRRTLPATLTVRMSCGARSPQSGRESTVAESSS